MFSARAFFDAAGAALESPLADFPHLAEDFLERAVVGDGFFVKGGLFG